jgi:hypothetical protein
MTKALTALAQRKTVFALVLALTIFGAVYGFAATLNLNTDQLSAGNATVGSCQTSGPATGTYSVVYDSSIPGYKVSGVTVTGVDSACAGKTVSATLTGAGSTSLGSASAAVPGGGGTVSLGSPTGTVSAAAVTGLSVAING